MNVDEVLQRAMNAYGTGNLGQAELLFNQVLGADKQRFDALHMLGICEPWSAPPVRRLDDRLEARLRERLQTFGLLRD